MTERKEGTIHCSNCRKDYTEAEIKKQPLDYVQGPDGKPTPAGSRFSIFCAVCDAYIGLADPTRDKTLAGFKKPTNQEPVAPPAVAPAPAPAPQAEIPQAEIPQPPQQPNA